MKVIKATLLLNLVWALGAFAAERLQVGFDDLPKLIGERNRHVSGAKSHLNASEKLTGHLVRSFVPTVDAHVGGETFRTGSFSPTSQPYGSVEMRWNFFQGGRDLLEERIREAQVQSSRALFDQMRLEELTKARNAYWTLVYQREAVEILVDALRQNEANLAAARKRIGAGIATDTDRIEFELYRVQLEQDLVRVKLGSANSQRTLSILLGSAADTQIDTEAVIPHQHDDAILAEKFEASAHREVRATWANQEVARNQKAQAYRWWTPQVDVYASYSLYTLRDREYLARADRDETVAGVRLSFNLLGGFQARAQGAAYGLQAEGFESQAAQTSRELSAQYEGSRQELALTHDLIHSAEKSVEQGAQYLKRTQAEYARGVKNSPDVFSATQKYIELKRRYAEIRRDYQLAKTEILAMLGR